MTDISEVLRVYQGSDADATKALYAEIAALNGDARPFTGVAVNLLRACKASERAKRYRGGDGRRSFRSQAYERKDWAIDQLCAALEANPHRLRWGWGVDVFLKAGGDPHHHVLYIDLPTGQVSFHTSARRAGPTYPGEWDRRPGQGADRICRWVARLFQGADRAG